MAPWPFVAICAEQVKSNETLPWPSSFMTPLNPPPPRGSLTPSGSFGMQVRPPGATSGSSKSVVSFEHPWSVGPELTACQ
jgi:hypothetical protein